MTASAPAEVFFAIDVLYNGLRNGAETVALVLGGVLVTTIGARWTLFLAGAAPAAGAVGLAVHRRGGEESARVDDVGL